MNNVKIKIIYEDNHLIVVEKPVNILSQGDNTGDIDMLTLLKQDLKERYNKPGEVYLGLLHRLDRTVGGLMVFAKTSKCASRVSEQIRKGQMQKTYLAIVHGSLEQRNGRIANYLYKDKSNNLVKVVPKDHKDSKEAILEYEVIDQNTEYSLVRINLITGRSHQIRVQFANIGSPLYGDKKYNGNVGRDEKQIALWSNKIKIVHPISKEEIEFDSFPMSFYPWSLFKIK